MIYTCEQLGGPFEALAALLMISHGLVYGLMLVLSRALMCTAGADKRLANVGPITAVTTTACIGAIVLPGLL